MKNGALYTWGYNNYGQCGTGNKVLQREPVLILTSNDIIRISVSGDNTAAIYKST